MIRNIVFDIGTVLVGFTWEKFYRSFGYSEEVFEKLAVMYSSTCCNYFSPN